MSIRIKLDINKILGYPVNQTITDEIYELVYNECEKVREIARNMSEECVEGSYSYCSHRLSGEGNKCKDCI